MTITVKVDPTHPWNNPASPTYRRNFRYVCQDSNGQNGWSFTYIYPHTYTNAGTVGGRYQWPAGKPGHFFVCEIQEVSFPDVDVQQWNYALKNQLAYYVSRGYLIVDDGGGPMTPDEIRSYTYP